MLVLSRKNGQKIIINDNIEITILESRFDNCKIAINAPKDVKIFREEVYIQIQEANKLSKATSVDDLSTLSDLAQNSCTTQNDNQIKKKSKVIIKKKN